MSDAAWDLIVRRLRSELGKGTLTLAEADALYGEAPEEPLSEDQIERLVQATIRRAKQLTRESRHWHLWIGLSGAEGHRSVTLHIAGIVGEDISVGQVSSTIRTPDWAVVSISSIDVRSDELAGSTGGMHGVGDRADSESTDSAGLDWNEVYWEVSTPLVAQESSLPCVDMAAEDGIEKHRR